MNIEDFQNLALVLANQMLIQIYYNLNYPQKPQIMGIRFIERPQDRLVNELEELGFVEYGERHIWQIERTDNQ